MADASSAEIAILMNVAELTKRFGLRPSDLEAFVYSQDEDEAPDGEFGYILAFTGIPTDDAVFEKYEKITDLLGIEGDSSKLKVPKLSDLEDAVDRALELAPRARTR